MKREYHDRIILSQWHEKWKDRGDDFDNGLNDPQLDSRLGAKSRWILLGFHDPDIHLLNRSVPTPDTQDVPLALQLIASIRGEAAIADVSSAFTQSIKGQRQGRRLFASAPPGGIPGVGEDEEVLIEILGEVYGLVSGPPGWRRTVLTELKDLGFRNHPLAPCVVLMYSDDDQQLVGVIVIETDDFLMGGLGDKWNNALDQLRRRFKFGSWTELMGVSKEYGGRTIIQLNDYGFKITMTRYLKMKVREIVLARGRCKVATDTATPGEVTGMCGLVGGMS